MSCCKLEREIVLDLVNAAANEIRKFAIAQGTVMSGSISGEIYVEDAAGAMQTISTRYRWSALNKDGTPIKSDDQDDLVALESTGQLTATWAVTLATDEITVKLTPSSSLTPTTMKITFDLSHNG